MHVNVLLPLHGYSFQAMEDVVEESVTAKKGPPATEVMEEDEIVVQDAPAPMTAKDTTQVEVKRRVCRMC